MDIKKVARAIEADAGQALPDLRQALAEVEQIRAGHLNGCRLTRAAIDELEAGQGQRSANVEALMEALHADD